MTERFHHWMYKLANEQIYKYPHSCLTKCTIEKKIKEDFVGSVPNKWISKWLISGPKCIAHQLGKK